VLRFIKVSSIFFLSLLIILAILPFFFEKERIVGLIEKEINSRLDIKTNFNDDINLTFFPVSTLEIEGLSFFDKKKNINIVIKLTKVSTSWTSLIKLKPKIQEIKLVSPKLKFQENNISKKFKNLKILAGNNSLSLSEKLNSIKEKINKLSIEDGSIFLNKSNYIHEFNQINLIFKENEENKFKGRFFYQNFPLDIFFEIVSKDFRNFDLKLEKIIRKKNRVQTSGRLLIDKNNISFRGNTKSNNLDIFEIFDFSNKLVTLPFWQEYILVKLPTNKFDIVTSVEIENIKIGKEKIENTNFQFFFDGTQVILKDLKSNYKESNLNSQINYKFSKNKILGTLKINDFFLEEKAFGKTDYDLYDGFFKCDLKFEFNDDFRNLNNFIKLIKINGDLISGPLKLKGIDLSKISNKIDDADTFQKLLSLLNQKNWAGFSKLNSVNGFFYVQNGKLFLKNVKASHENLKILSNGTYNLIKDEIDIKNEVSVSTEKYKDLPPFRVNFFGPFKNYKTSYNLDKIKGHLFSHGINQILKEKKKLIIDPKSFKKMLKEKDFQESINPEEILDLFIN